MITSYQPKLRAVGAKRNARKALPAVGRLCPSKDDDVVDDNDDYGDDMVLVEKFIPMQLLFTFHTTMTRRMKLMMWTMIAMMMIRHDIG